MTQTPDPLQPLDRRAAWVLAGFSALLLAALSAWLVPWDWLPGRDLVPADVRDVFTEQQLARAENRASTMRLLSWSSYAVSLAVASLLGFTSAGRSLVLRVGVEKLPWWLGSVLAPLVLVVLGRLVTLPFGLLIRRRNLADGLTNQGLAAWFGDWALSALLSWVVLSLLVVLVVGTARRSPRHWFVWAGAAVVGLTFVVSLLYPVVVEPMFNRFTPLPEGSFKDSVIRLADKEGVEVDDVLVSDASRRTTTLNAYVSGLGGTRRIVIYDNLLQDATPEEVRAVVAHELAHARHRDVVLGTTLGATAALGGVALLALLLDSRVLRRRAGVRGPADPTVAALVAALLALGGFLSSPAQSTVSRAIEARADRTALDATADPDAFRGLQRQLALRSLADPTPPAWSQFWFGSHPTVLQRLGIADALDDRGR